MSLEFCLFPFFLAHKPDVSTPRTLTITCGLRNGPRKPMWKSQVLSTEAIQAVQSLKLAQKSSSKLEVVIRNKLARLLKPDLLDALAELQRQNELDLALKVLIFANYCCTETCHFLEINVPSVGRFEYKSLNPMH